MISLPLPSPEQLAHSADVAAEILAEIAASGGWISFSRFMEMALYAPGLGYYSAGMQKFGAGGDFVTAPEISSLFGRTLARQAAQVVRAGGDGDVMELGAGTGRLAVQLLAELQQLNALPGRYLILEVSAHLRAVQQETIRQELPAVLASRVEWLDALPEKFAGCMVGNEVLDALPVHLVAQLEDGLYERGVGVEGGTFVWRERTIDGVLADTARSLALPQGYVTEVCQAAPALIASLAERLQHGALLLIDYGFPHREYYHPQRSGGTLMCHYRHHAHDDPFIYPGLQDITAHVDFTAIAEAGVAHGLHVSGYVSQAQFLINSGITDLLTQVSPSDAAAYFPLAAEAQKLISPAEMGELFKVIALSKEMVEPLLGFVRGDKRHTL